MTDSFITSPAKKKLRKAFQWMIAIKQAHKITGISLNCSVHYEQLTNLVN